MKEEDIEKLLCYSDYKGIQSDLYMPNEVFEDLKNNIINSPHIAFAYSYLYLCTWLYRNCKHTVCKGGVSNKIIKEILGYDPKNRSVNYLIKKKGLLDTMEYTMTQRDFPISVKYDGELEFSMLSEMDDREDPRFCYEMSTEAIVRREMPNNFTIKFPVKAFHRTIVIDGEEAEDLGTFYNVENTHNIPFEAFMYCMGNEEIGCIGFYLYSYLKHKNDIHEGGYDVSLEGLVEETGIAERTLDKYLGLLKGYRLIEFEHNQKFFALGMKKEDRKANTYITNHYRNFKQEYESFKTIPKVSKRDYIKMLQDEEENKAIWGQNKVDISLEELPY